jgi:hypothetical protein
MRQKLEVPDFLAVSHTKVYDPAFTYHSVSCFREVRKPYLGYKQQQTTNKENAFGRKTI